MPLAKFDYNASMTSAPKDDAFLSIMAITPIGIVPTETNILCELSSYEYWILAVFEDCKKSWKNLVNE
jgi:hypothetical protein